MIIEAILFILGIIMDLLVYILDFLVGGFSLWPENLVDGLTYFFTNLMNFDFVLNIYQLILVIEFLYLFFLVYVPAKLIVKVVNWIRGSGSIEI